MEHIRIKHGEHELEIEGDQSFIQGQLEQFYISIENYEKLIRELCCNGQCTETRKINEEIEVKRE